MLNNKLTEKQQEVFLDIYKTVLQAEISNPITKNLSSEDYQYSIRNALTVSMRTINMLFDDNGEFKTLDGIISEYENNYNKFTEFPDIESNTEAESENK